ncbi:MAG: cytidine deaminase [candidate division WOR-3 bacterium]|nr:cytidine deaminase [candidate division WOR-3 bacterium]MCX7836694.1 cytidine deaminase [candidate division WOR-3 bacterium]MDW8113469.1 cytidine deaminase [candidate division WOR-3 bacterium]
MKQIKKYIDLLKKIVKNSYSPYSQFPVATLLITKNNIYSGVNIENVSFSLTICAERVAVFKAISEGEKSFQKLIIYTPTKDFTYPCGACLQVLKEFERDLEIILINNEGKIKKERLKNLIKSFSPPSLKK